MSAITWHGLTATYTVEERADMRRLAEHDPHAAAVIHELKALCGARLILDRPRRGAEAKREEFVYVWGNSERRRELKGRRCVVEARGAKRSVRVRFLDNGERVVCSVRALRKAA